MPPASVIRAVDHPYRRNMLHILAREAMTYSQLFASMEPRGGGRGRFNYHLKVLREAGLIGIQEDRYGLTPNGKAAVAFLEEVNRSRHDAATLPRGKKPLTVAWSLLVIGAIVVTLLLTVLIPLPISSPSIVQRPGWSTPSLLGENTRGAVAFDPQGNGLRVWSHQVDGVYGSRYDPETGWSAPLLISGGKADDVRIALDSQGDGFVTWLEEPTWRRLIATRFLSGVGWESPTVIFEAAAGHGALLPVVAHGPSGDAVVVWQSCRKIFDDGDWYWGGCDVLSKRYAPETGWSQHWTISQNPVEHLAYPRAGIDRWGNALAVWNGPNDEGGGGQVWANRFTLGSGWGTPVPISGDPGSIFRPDLSVGPSGEAFVAWYLYDNENDVYLVHANRFTLASGWRLPSALATLDHWATESRWGSRPDVHVGPEGDAIVVWDEAVYSGSVYEGDAIRAARFVRGVGWGEPTLVDHTDAGFYCRTSASSPHGTVLVGWMDEGNDESGVPPAAYVNRYFPGPGWSGRELVGRQDPVAFWMTCPALSLGSEGDGLAVWTQLTDHPGPGMTRSMYVNRFVAPSDPLEIGDILVAVEARFLILAGLIAGVLVVVGILFVLHWRLRMRFLDETRVEPIDKQDSGRNER